MIHRMLKKSAALAGVALLATGAQAMTINPNGTGQVLIYPYYTVNKHQQTLFTVGNPTAAGKAVQVTFREGYNGKVVYAIDVFLAPHASWNAAVFAPEDASKIGSGAALVSTDTSCKDAIVHTSATGATPDFPYDYFSNASYVGGGDTGPTNDARQREGFIEAIEMAEIQGSTLNAISTVEGTIDCSKVPPLANANPADFTTPTGGLIGAAAVIDVPQGTYFTFEPRAIDGFRAQPVVPPAIVQLTDAGVSQSNAVTASLVYQGAYLTLTFPRAQAINAVSAMFMADSVYGELDQSSSIGANTDWVLTFPTKEFYVNVPQPAGLAPFDHLFNAGGSMINTDYATSYRDGSPSNYHCGFNECPPILTTVQTQTQVITFLPLTTPPSTVLGSSLVTPAPADNAPQTATFTFSGQLGGSNEGYALIGVPVFGVQATNYVDSNVTAGVLSNYSGTAALRTTLSCARNGVPCP